MSDSTSDLPRLPEPHPALQRLAPLVGEWRMRGGTAEAPNDDLSGRVLIAWLPGGHYLELRGEMEFGAGQLFSLEVVGYDPETDTFPSYVFSGLDGAPARYWWDVRGDAVTHWTAGSKYTGRLSRGGALLAGGWRPDPGVPATPGNNYDALMEKIAS